MLYPFSELGKQSKKVTTVAVAISLPCLVLLLLGVLYWQYRFRDKNMKEIGVR